ncbi:4786_t:CDS:2 [Scutellospora calospora]|uniref:4786_t:CDS:1 n=1 Tax=Scutellospora calospora TaxID=85575 RepID=A0ACA9MLA9_9GLOM|nr:4786_t:CDS:2 [Scutellospora calospora]
MTTSPEDCESTAISNAIPIKPKPKHGYAASISSISSVLSDQITSVTSIPWAPSSFGSTLLGMTHSNSVAVLDPLAQKTLVKEMAKKTIIDLEVFLNQLYNDSSLGLYHISEHIRKRKGLINLEKDIEVTISDMKDSYAVVKTLPTISSFSSISDLLKNTLEVVETAKSKK